MLIKIIMWGHQVIEVCLDSGSVHDALAIADVSIDRWGINVNGHRVSSNHMLENGDCIVLAPLTARGEACFKVAGRKWAVHKYDPDDIFPSDFHAHDYEHRETLDLYTRNVFDSVTRKSKGRLAKKHFETLLHQLNLAGFDISRI